MHHTIRTSLLLVSVAGWVWLWSGSSPTSAQESVELSARTVGAVLPERVDLRSLETRIAQVLEACRAATVHVEVPGEIGSSNGSGVTVSADGLVLTASHVVGGPERPAFVTLADGTRLRAITLGNLDYQVDADCGMLRIVEPGEYAFAPLLDTDEGPGPGEWCLALGFPGGYDNERGAVLRVGRLIERTEHRIRTDCILLGGDSGGPLFDLDGRVIGIHSAIARRSDANFHAPIEAFRLNWSALKEGYPFLGVSTRDNESGAMVDNVLEGTAAAAAGVRVGDLIVSVDGVRVSGPSSLQGTLLRKTPRQSVTLRLERAGQTIVVQCTLGRRWNVFETSEVPDD